MSGCPNRCRQPFHSATERVADASFDFVVCVAAFESFTDRLVRSMKSTGPEARRRISRRRAATNNRLTPESGETVSGNSSFVFLRLFVIGHHRPDVFPAIGYQTSKADRNARVAAGSRRRCMARLTAAPTWTDIPFGGSAVNISSSVRSSPNARMTAGGVS